MHCYRQQGTIEVTSSGDNQGTLVATELGFWSRKDSQMECRGWGRDFLCPISGITVLAAYCLVSRNSIFSFFFSVVWGWRINPVPGTPTSARRPPQTCFHWWNFFLLVIPTIGLWWSPSDLVTRYPGVNLKSYNGAESRDHVQVQLVLLNRWLWRVISTHWLPFPFLSHGSNRTCLTSGEGMF